MKTKFDIISFGTIYLDIDFLHFPFEDGLYTHRETVGDVYSLEAGGSAFNFAKMCGNLDQKVLFIGQLGGDYVADVVKSITKESSVQTHFIENKLLQSNIAMHYVKENGDSIMTSAGSANQNFSAAELEKLLMKYIASAKYLYLGGGLKLHTILPLYPKLISLAKKYNVQIVLDHGRVTNLVTPDHKEIIKSIITDINIYLPSRDEFLDLWGYKSVNEGLKHLDSLMNGIIIVKDSVNGCHTIQNGEVFSVIPVKVKPKNTIGAGDSFNAGFIKASSIDIGSLKEKMQYASSVAAIKISSLNFPNHTEALAAYKKEYR
jgi:sugar/nucleoside kinase (ribokinase family)